MKQIFGKDTTGMAVSIAEHSLNLGENLSSLYCSFMREGHGVKKRYALSQQELLSHYSEKKCSKSRVQNKMLARFLAGVMQNLITV